MQVFHNMRSGFVHIFAFYSLYTVLMSGERASTVRMRLAGKICAKCGNRLQDEPPTPGERLCPNCRSPQIHRVYMYYMLRERWMCQFLEEDLKTPLPRRLYFSDAGKIRTIVEKVGNFADLQDRQALDYGLEIGRGGVWLQLTQEQYDRLKSQSDGRSAES